MNEPDQQHNSLDRTNRPELPEPDRPCLICQTPLKIIPCRPFPFCTPCLYELSDRIDKAQSQTRIGNSEPIGFVLLDPTQVDPHSQN